MAISANVYFFKLEKMPLFRQKTLKLGYAKSIPHEEIRYIHWVEAHIFL